LTTCFWIPRLGMGAALLALFAFMAACVFSVSSAQAGLLTSAWNFDNKDFTANPNELNATLSAESGYQIINQSHSAPWALAVPKLKTLTITFNPSGLSSFALSYYFEAKSSQASSVQWSYVANNGHSGNLGTSLTAPSYYTLEWVDFSSFIVSGATSVTLTAKAGTPGAIMFDDISLTAVPEPITYALGGFGLIFVGGSAGRFYLRRRCSATAS